MKTFGELFFGELSKFDLFWRFELEPKEPEKKFSMRF